MRGLDQQRLKDAFWKARAAKYILDRDCALRNIRGVFQQCNVTSHKRRRCKSKHLPKWEIPRHDRQNRSDRLVMNKRTSAASLNNFVSEPTFRRFRKMSADPCAFGGSGNSRTQRFAHLEPHQLRKRLSFAAEDFCRMPHHPCALRDRHAPVDRSEERRVGKEWRSRRAHASCRKRV